jgi:hypothetical protein
VMNNRSQKSEENTRPQQVLRPELSGDAAIHNGTVALRRVRVGLALVHERNNARGRQAIPLLCFNESQSR